MSPRRHRQGHQFKNCLSHQQVGVLLAKAVQEGKEEGHRELGKMLDREDDFYILN